MPDPTAPYETAEEQRLGKMVAAILDRVMEDLEHYELFDKDAILIYLRHGDNLGDRQVLKLAALDVANTSYAHEYTEGVLKAYRKIRAREMSLGLFNAAGENIFP